MYKIINLFMLFLVALFILTISKYYFSNKNLDNKSYNRSNIDEILKEKITDLKVLENDTNSIIEFNNSLDGEINEDKKRNFWDLLKK
tara:strand:+ start:214 stop:474 length:261 start_codon:yes stop_codon:yes gene_type:complete